MKEAIQTLITSDKMAHAFEYLKQDEAHTIDLSTGEENLSSPSLRLIGYNLKLNF